MRKIIFVKARKLTLMLKTDELKAMMMFYVADLKMMMLSFRS